MNSRKTWCGLFTTSIAAIGGTTWYLSQYMASLAKESTEHFLYKVLNSELVLRNLTVNVSTSLLPEPVEFTMERMAFTLQQAITKDLADTLAEVPDSESENTKNVILLSGAILLGITTGIFLAAKKDKPAAKVKVSTEKEEPLLETTPRPK